MLIAENFVSLNSLPDITDATVGDRAVGLVTQSLRVAANLENAPLAELALVVRHEIANACGPNGAVPNAIADACRPDGAISNAMDARIEAACRPNGAVSNVIAAACAIRRAMADHSRVQDAIKAARAVNQSLKDAQATLAALPDHLGSTPDDFPATVEEFFKMDRPAVRRLLEFYGLPVHGGLEVQRGRLAAHIGIPAILM
jgi:hypothetical protein